ncbi:hypothetical protein [Microbispora sp. H10885]|uniref:hypothetical protein n=1 Tax=Microbispora sp. H10885 TaxID=2729110 RepID=UPI0016028B8F|nr:hypothetical protein [Microbispora sp. H10885]
MADEVLRALYYPFSRTLQETTLKRAILLYDEVLFIDPKSARVRAGLYDVEQHQQYLPGSAAHRLSAEWTQIADRYALLESEGLVRFVDPGPVIEQGSVDQLITGAMQADMLDQQVIDLFAGQPPTWSMLRSRIPASALQFLSHQYTPRVLYPENTRRPFEVIDGLGHALFADGKPNQEFSLPGWQKRSAVPQEREWAAVLPYYLGSSIATTTALAMSVETVAVPLTDSDAHFRLLSARFARAAEIGPTLANIPGLRRASSQAAAQKYALVEQRIIDSVLDKEALDALSLEQCLRYREETADERRQFRSHLASIVRKVASQPWSPRIEDEIDEAIQEARRELDDHKEALRSAYRSLFKRTVVGLSVTSAPVLLTTLFPGVSPLLALLLGGGTFSGILSEPIKDVVNIWLDRTKSENGLAYLMKLPGAK